VQRAERDAQPLAALLRHPENIGEWRERPRYGGRAGVRLVSAREAPVARRTCSSSALCCTGFKKHMTFPCRTARALLTGCACLARASARCALPVRPNSAPLCALQLRILRQLLSLGTGSDHCQAGCPHSSQPREPFKEGFLSGAVACVVFAEACACFHQWALQQTTTW
jgi:hypothetical protein